MHLAHSIERLRRGSVLVVLGVALAVITLGLSQCRMVDEQLTGVSLAKATMDKCLSDCGKTYDHAVKDEDKLNKSNNKACKGNPACLAAEITRHLGVLAGLKDALTACQQSCQHQGSGGGGR